MIDVLVLGGGVAGLEAALGLSQQGFAVELLEASTRVGGSVTTETVDGFRCELGAATLRADGAILNERCDEFGIALRALGGGARRKGILTGAGLTYVGGPGDLMRSRLLSAGGKARALLEPLQGSSSNDNESLEQFMVRRLGSQAGQLMAPLLARGVYAAPASQLCVRTAFPRLYAMDQNKGLIRGMTSQTRAGIISLPGGLGALAQGYAHQLSDRIALETPAVSIERNAQGWSVTSAQGRLTANDLVVATPAPIAATLLAQAAPQLSQTLDAMQRSELTSVQLGFHGQQLPESFGFLVHPSAGGETLGCLFASQINSDAAPKGSALVGCMVGVSSDPVASARATLEQALGWTAEPDMVLQTDYPAGLPLYNAEHDRLRAQVQDQLLALPGLQLAGNYLRGISVESSLESGRLAAEVIMAKQTTRRVA
jgi:oxygen-dependent protoporphyrinogen oxidase